MTIKKSRRLGFENLENRRLLAADFGHNFLLPVDVNDDRLVSPIDALVVINVINNPETDLDSFTLKVDVNDDSIVSPIDALQVINRINNQSPSPSSAVSPAESIHSSRETWIEGADGTRGRIEFEREGTQLELSIKVINAIPGDVHEVKLNNVRIGELVIDTEGRGKLELESGDDGGHQQIFDSVLEQTGMVDVTVGTLFDGRIDLSVLDSDHEHDESHQNEHDDDSANPTQSSLPEMELKAKFAKIGGIEREAEYEIEHEDGELVRRFRVEIEHALPMADYGVRVDGIEVGILSTDSRGKAKLRFSSSPSEDGEIPFPDSFPTVAEGAEIVIGTATSRFVLDD